MKENPETIPPDSHLEHIDPQAFKDVFEAQNGEPLAWSQERADALKNVGALNKAPEVGTQFGGRGNVGVTDGRHRIGEAAERGQDSLPVRVANGDSLPESVLAKPAALAGYLHGGGQGIPYSVAAKWDPPMRAKAAERAGLEPPTPGGWNDTLGQMQQLEADLAARKAAEPPPPETPDAPEDPAAPAAANQWERANREAKTDKLAAFLYRDGKGISHADALRMDPNQWKLAAQGAGVNEPSPASVGQSLDKLQRLEASQPIAQRLADLVNGKEAPPAPSLTGGMGLHLEQNVDGSWAFNGKVPPAAQGKTWPSFAAAMQAAKKNGFEGYVNNRLRGY